MKYKIQITEISAYEAIESVYEAEDGKRYTSTYRIPDGVKYTEKYKTTGETKYSEKVIYSQEAEMPDILDVIKAANGILK